MASEEGNSPLIRFLGDTAPIRIIDFLMDNRLSDFTKAEMAKGANISRATLFNHWDELEAHHVLKVTRTVGRIKLYHLNESEPLVKEIKRLEMRLISRAADAQEEKMVAKVRSPKMKER